MFTASTFDFLRDLRANNTREWFEANRARSEREGKAPLQTFIEAFRQRLQAISPHFAANERSVFRIFRDVRFSRDKSPYKTHLAAQFRHAAVKAPAGEVVHAPGFIAVVNFSEAEAGHADFVDRFAEACARAAPLQSFLCGVLGLPF